MTAADFDWCHERWVMTVPDRKAYLDLVGADRVAELGVKEHAFSAVADFGY
jgi:hypothetical protein